MKISKKYLNLNIHVSDWTATELGVQFKLAWGNPAGMLSTPMICLICMPHALLVICEFYHTFIIPYHLEFEWKYLNSLKSMNFVNYKNQSICGISLIQFYITHSLNKNFALKSKIYLQMTFVRCIYDTQ